MGVSMPMWGFPQGNGQWIWPEDRTTAVEKHVMYTDYMKTGQYKDAIAPLEWLLTNAPSLNVSLYIHGVKIYSELAKKEVDEGQRNAYVDRIIALFDARAQKMGKKATVANRKAIRLYELMKDNPLRREELIGYFKEAIELNGHRVFAANIIAYMVTLHKYKKEHPQEVTDSHIVEEYLRMGELLEQKKEDAQEKKLARLEDISQKIEKIFTNSVSLDCGFIDETFGQRVREGDDIEDAKKYIVLHLRKQCENKALFIEAVQRVFEVEPSYQYGRVLARHHIDLREYDKAIGYYKRVLANTDNPDNRASIYINLAKISILLGNKSQARNYAQRAIKAGPNYKKEGENLIGTLYIDSYEECKGRKNRVQDKAIYIAAYNHFASAENTNMMQECRAHFPTIEEMFELGYEVGNKMQIDCWIDEEVILIQPN